MIKQTELMESGCKSCSFHKNLESLGFKIYRYQANYKEVISNLQSNTILFIHKGEAHIHYNDVFSVAIKSLQMILIPQGADILIHIIEDTEFLVMEFDSYTTICKQIQETDYSQYINTDGYALSPLPILPQVEKFLDLLIDVMQRGIDCLHFHDSKRKEFFFYLKAYYTEAQIANLLYPILSSRFQFKDFIYRNYKNVDSVNELIKLSGMSRSPFFDRFKQEFGMTAKQWMISKKSESILIRLSEPNASIKEIMFDFGFSSPSQFNRFCRHYLGDTPTNLLHKIDA